MVDPVTCPTRSSEGLVQTCRRALSLKTSTEDRTRAGEDRISSSEEAETDKQMLLELFHAAAGKVGLNVKLRSRRD